MIFCVGSLVWFLLKTRGHDNLPWWLLRTFLLHALVCAVYMSYEAWYIWDHLPINLLFIRLGFVSMIGAMLLMWHLLNQQKREFKKNLFNARLGQIFKEF